MGEEPTELDPMDYAPDEVMKFMADRISVLIGQKYGFVLITFPFAEKNNVDHNSYAHYISNANRQDIIRTLREKADALETGMVIPVTPDTKVKH